jgi:hypothetical protein
MSITSNLFVICPTVEAFISSDSDRSWAEFLIGEVGCYALHLTEK